MLFRVCFDVTTKRHAEEPVRHKRAVLVEAGSCDSAEVLARPAATNFNFGPRVIAVEWRSTSSVRTPVDVTDWKAEEA